MDEKKSNAFGPARIQFAHDLTVMDLYAKYFGIIGEAPTVGPVEVKEVVVPTDFNEHQ